MTTSIFTDDVNVSFFSLKGVMTRNNEDLSVLLAIGDNWQCYSGEKKRTYKESTGRGTHLL